MKILKVIPVVLLAAVAALALALGTTGKMTAGSPLIGKTSIIEGQAFDPTRFPSLQSTTLFVGINAFLFIWGARLIPNTAQDMGENVEQLLHDLG